MEPKLAVVPVRDPRILRLSEMYEPKKTVFATIELADFPGTTDKAEKGDMFSTEMLQHFRNMDALGIVLRNFTDDYDEAPDAVADLSVISDEFIMADLIVVENRLDKIEASNKRGMKTPEMQIEEKILLRIKAQLEENKPLRDLSFTVDESKQIRGFTFLTLKPWLLILNSGEKHFKQSPEIVEQLSKSHPVIEFAGKFEMELTQFTDVDEIALFMEDMGITDSARDRLAGTVYEILGYISFFTVGSDEVRAWNIFRGTKAQDAAGTIHSDLSRGFIRAECFTYDDLISAGDEKTIKTQGKFRLEGKEYIVQDGDIMSIRFNV